MFKGGKRKIINSLFVFLFIFIFIFAKNVFAADKATYKINDAKDQDGNILTVVKIYVDGAYIHHYAPEILTFCDGCTCDGYTDCSFGQHAIVLEKSNFDSWSESREIDPGGVYEVNPVMQVLPTPTPSPTLVPTVTLTPTSTPVPTATSVPAATGTYKINEVKDSTGTILDAVKIYVDDIYIHHYAPEVITFCSNCQCDTDVNCNFGSHVFRVEKTDYNSWSETRTINANDSIEVSPVINLPQPTATNTPTMTLTPTITPTPSKIPTPTPTPTESDEPGVLSESTSAGSMETETAAIPSKIIDLSLNKVITPQKTVNPLPYVLIALGVGFTGISGFLFLKTKKDIGSFK